MLFNVYYKPERKSIISPFCLDNIIYSSKPLFLTAYSLVFKTKDVDRR